MKTPREIILQRHQAAASKLSNPRVEDLAALVTADSRPLLQQFWREAIWPWRRVWVGLAGAWVVILGLALTAGSSAAAVNYTAARANDQIQLAVRDQRRLLAQLLAPPMPPAAMPAALPGKRSEETPTVTIV